MARIVKEPAIRRNEILDTAQQLIGSKGYEQMTIQDILSALQISKGGFYHYFDSKQALLEALIERMQGEMDQLLHPIVHDSHLSALTRLQRFFAAFSHYKTDRQGFFIALSHIWYTDDNAIVRQKVRAARVKQVAPLLAAVIRQGDQEGVLTAAYPEQASEIALSIVLDLSDTLAIVLLEREQQQETPSRLEHIVAGYSDALERVLGAPAGSLPLVDGETLKAWFVSMREDDAK